MEMLAVLLLPLSFAALLRRENFRESFLLSALAAALFLALCTELLSLFQLLAYTPLALCWSAYLAALLLFRYLTRGRGGHRPGGHEPEPLRAEGGLQKALLLLLALLFGLTGVTALVAAPNNFDSLTYHLPRIMHWIQNGSVAHYPTHIDRQLVLAPFSEFVMLHLHLLSGGDRFDNCVQWFAMLGSALGVSLVVRQLGGSVGAQLAAAALAASLPMGLLQATSTQNDYAVAFWLVCLLFQVIKAGERPDLRSYAAVGLSLALAIFTKGTAYLVAFPFLALFLWRAARSGTARAAGALLLAGLLFLVNGGHFARNLALYGNPITPGTGNDIICTEFGARAALSCLAKNVATQLASGLPGADRTLGQATEELHRVLGVELGDPDLSTRDPFALSARIHEDFVPNPGHMALLLAAALALAAGWRSYAPQTRVLALSAMLSFVALSVAIKWNPFVSRYFLSVFILSSPLLALIYDRPKARPWLSGCALLLLLGSFPVLARNEMRPLLGPASVFRTQRMDQYFMVGPQAKPYFASVAALIEAKSTGNVGLLDRNGNMWEYILWVQLKERGGNYRIEHVGVQNNSGAIPLRGFSRYFPVLI